MTRTSLRCHVSFVHSVEESGEPLALCAKGSKGSKGADIPGRNGGLAFCTECCFGLFLLFIVLRRTG